ncbi:MAG: hypothetical protein AAF694_04975 [Bacteroidota bacterium]
MLKDRIDRWHKAIFNEHRKHRFELWILYFALIGLSIHLLLIFLNYLGFLPGVEGKDSLLDNPISAIYTPFSFILISEVYLLIYYLPSSFSTSIGKQYEIISLILIRRIFKDMANLEIGVYWFESYYDMQLTIDMVGVLLLIFFIYLFYYLNDKRPKVAPPTGLEQFISFKKAVSVFLLPILLGMLIYSFGGWLIEARAWYLALGEGLSDINDIFYDEFFTLLIIVDVFILLISLKYTQSYILLVRNSGFVISTILIRQSFTASGPTNVAIILGAVLFGVVIQGITNLMMKNEMQRKV